MNHNIHFLAGALGGMMGSIVTSPLDVIRTRFQSAANKELKMRPFRYASHVIKSEGYSALWKGVSATLIGVAPARAIYFYTYSNIKDRFTQIPGINFISACCAGIVTAHFTGPLWMVKTRLQIQNTKSDNKHLHYNGYRDAVIRIYKEEGILGFYKGLTASYWNAMEGGIQFTLYQNMKTITMDLQDRELNRIEVFSLASVSKLIAASLTYPFEVVRTRLREQRTSNGKYKSVLQAIKLIIKEEGIGNLYVGLRPHLMRVVPNAAIMVMVVEIVVNNKL